MGHKQCLEYFRQREHDLTMVCADLCCRPFSQSTRAPELVVAVDWSEIHAHIFNGARPANDAIERLVRAKCLRRGLADGIHQVALGVLFDRLPMQLLLLPAYTRELVHFVRLAQTKLISADLAHDQIEGAREELAKTSALTSLSAILKEAANEPPELQYEAFNQLLEQQGDKRLSAWASTAFAAMYHFARWSNEHGAALANLKRLVLPAEPDGNRRLGSIGELVPTAAQFIKAESLPGHRWLGPLEACLNEKKSAVTLRLDAEALDFLAALNSVLASQNKQLVFITRGRDIESVMSHYPGNFAGLSDQYFDPNLPERINSIYRSWTYLYELGLALDSGTLATARRFAEVRLWDVRTRLRTITEQSRSAVVRSIRRELDAGTQNRRALLAAVPPRLPHQISSDSKAQAIRQFVAYVTDPKTFKLERERLRTEAEDGINTIQQDLAVNYEGQLSADPLPFPHALLARRLIRDCPQSILLADVREPKASTTLGLLYKAIKQSVTPSRDVRSKIRGLRRLVGEASFVQCLLTLAYACHSFSQLEYFLTQYEAILRKNAPCTASWLLWTLMQCDSYVANHAPMRARVLLRDRWKALGGTARLRPRNLDATIIAAYLNAWLVLELNSIESDDENVANFPTAANDVDVPEVLAVALLLLDMAPLSTGNPLPSRLALSIVNNVLYACARVIPITDEDVTHSSSVLIHGKRPTLRPPTALLAKYAAWLASRRRLQPEHYDTLGYYHMKQAYIVSMDSPVGKRHIAASNRAFEAGRRFGAKCSERAKRSLDGHIALLRKLESLSHSSRV